MSVDERPTLNMSAISVAGVGGLAMLAVVAIVAGALSPARWLLVGGVGGGTVLAILLILGRRHPAELATRAATSQRASSCNLPTVDLPATDDERKSSGPLRRVSLPA